MPDATALISVGAVFFLALTSALYVASWLLTAWALHVGRGRFSNHVAKRIAMAGLIAPLGGGLMATFAGTQMRHPMASGGMVHHSETCAAWFGWAARTLPGGGGTLAGVIGVAGWLLLLSGLALLARLVVVTLQLERGILPYLLPPSPVMRRSLDRVAEREPRVPSDRFFECPIPAGFSSVLGFTRARCILSREFVASAPDAELDAVIAHEAGHLLERDSAAAFVVGALNCLFFFIQPVRLLARRWRESAELAADDAAVAATGDPLAVASAIVSMTKSAAGVGDGAVRLPAVALPFADYAACPPSARVARLIAQAEHASSAVAASPRFVTALGWLATATLAVLGVQWSLSPEAACASHCALQSFARLF